MEIVMVGVEFLRRFLQRIGPYFLVELLLPGGSLLALALFLYRRRRPARLQKPETAAAVFKEHGALRVVDCWGDDVPQGKLTSFPLAVKRKDDERVVFAWVTWPSRQVRDKGMKKVVVEV